MVVLRANRTFIFECIKKFTIDDAQKRDRDQGDDKMKGGKKGEKKKNYSLFY